MEKGKISRSLLWRKAQRMGFDCIGFEPQCEGTHENVWMGTPYRDCGRMTASVAVRCCRGLVGNVYLEDAEIRRAEAQIIRRAIAHVRKQKRTPARQMTVAENRRWLTERAQQHPNYPGAIAAARQLGFGCTNYRAPSLICRILGHHVRPFAMRTCSGDGGWSIDAECCRIGGHFTPEFVCADPPPLKPKVRHRHWSLRQLIGDLLRLLMPPPRLPIAPKPVLTIVRETVKFPSLWEPGSTAFWLDPELWSRTPEVNGRPEKCWMFLDVRPRRAEKPRQRFEIRKVGGKILERHYIG